MTLSVLPLLALAGHVTIDDVSAGAADNQVTVEVKTSAPVETRDVRSKFERGVIQLYLDGGHVGRKRAIKSGGFGISVLKRTDYAKVEVPLAAELGCLGPVRVEAGESGFTATMKCQGASAPAAEEVVEEKPAAAVATTKEAEKAVAAPDPAPATAAKVEAEKPTTATTTTTTSNAESAPVEKAAEPVKAAPPPASAPITTAQMPAKSSSSAMMMPALALIAIGAVAYFLKRRQAKKTSMIEILETAQLGPKRQLVVARVNGETMILGSSEAGITCLSGLHRLPPMGSEGTMSSIFQMSQMNQMQMAAMNQMNQMNQMGQVPQAPAQAPQQFHTFDPPAAPKGPIAEFTDEGGILTRLFRARGQDKPQEKFENIELHEFDNLLQESVADQELRRKLSSGFRGKVS